MIFNNIITIFKIMIKLFFYILPFLVVFLPSLWVNYVLKKFNVTFSDMPFTGKELGKKILEEQNIIM